MPVGRVQGFDLATVMGVAIGEPNGKPISRSIALKKRGEDQDAAFGRLLTFLHQEWAVDRPALVVVEARLPLQASKRLGNSQANNDLTGGLHGVLGAVAWVYKVPIVRGHMATIRKHFIGKGRSGERSLTKADIITRCHILGYLPKDVEDDNRADALAAWDWACATFAKARPAELFLYGEKAL